MYRHSEKPFTVNVTLLFGYHLFSLFAYTVRNYLRVKVTSSNVISGEVVVGRATPSTDLVLSPSSRPANKTLPVAPTTSDTEVVPIATYHLAMLLL